MTIQTVRNGIFATFTACGPWAASEISTCSFDVLESVSACAITYFPDGTSLFEPETMGNPRQVHKTWLIGGTVWIKDTGNPVDVLSRIWQAYDDVQTTLAKDETFQGALGNNGAGYLRQITNQLDRFREAGGHLWKPIEWVVAAEEY